MARAGLARMTRLCRFNDNRLGLVEGAEVIDVSPALDVLPAVRWPAPQADLLVQNLQQVVTAARRISSGAPRKPLDAVTLLSPVANPPKVIGAPVNYLKHQAEANADGGKNFDKDVKTIDHYGLFLKSSTAVVGPGEGIRVSMPDRRTDHEIELVVVIGQGGRMIEEHDALAHVAGYTMGLDMTIRGPEDRSLRKSLDTFSLLGPWLVTADEVSDPDNLALRLAVNGVTRQQASTRDLIFSVRKLIAYASRFYALCPGDVIYTGTPEGVGPVVAGDQIDCHIEGIGSMRVAVHG